MQVIHQSPTKPNPTKSTPSTNSASVAEEDAFFKGFRIFIGCLIGVSFLSAFLMLSANYTIHAYDGEGGDTSAVDQVSVTIPSACTMTGVVDSAHTTTLTSGTFAENIGQTTITAFCNDHDGFVIYSVGMSGDAEGNNKLLNTDRRQSTSDIQTGVHTSGSSTSSWAMKLTALHDEDVSAGYAISIDDGFDSDHTVPDTWTMVAHRDSATEVPTPGSTGTAELQKGASFTTTYSVFATSHQLTGTYLGKVAYAMFHPYTTADPTSLKKAFQDAAAQSNGTITTESITVNPNDPTKREVKSFYKMQDMTPEICAAANLYGEASQVELIDMRDHNIYWVAKLADGHCWMTQNLDINLSTSGASYSYVDSTGTTQTGTTTLNSTNTNIAYQDTIPATGVYSTASGYNNVDGKTTWTPVATTLDGTTDGATVIANSWSTSLQSQTAPMSVDLGDWYVNGTYFTSSECNYLTAASCTNIKTEPFATNGNHGKIGNYYNWTASIATNNSSSYASSTVTNISNNPQNSICPAGWRLPTISNADSTKAGSTDEFSRLNVLYNGGSTGNDRGLFNAPIYAVRGGQRQQWRAALPSLLRVLLVQYCEQRYERVPLGLH